MFTLKRSTTRPELFGQTVVVIGDAAGNATEIAGRARAEGAEVIVTDAVDRVALERVFDELPGPIDQVVVTPAGAESEPLALAAAQDSVGKIRPGGTLVLADGSGTVFGPRFTAALTLALAPVRVRVSTSTALVGALAKAA